MALVVIGRHGQSGRVVVRDSRPEGAYVLLICDPLDPGIEGAIGIEPSSENEDKATNGFPWLESFNRHIGREEKPFELTIETSKLPSGPAMFQTERFLSRVTEGAGRGEKNVELSLANAEEWGYAHGVEA